jgi:hypothetical protein
MPLLIQHEFVTVLRSDGVATGGTSAEPTMTATVDLAIYPPKDPLNNNVLVNNKNPVLLLGPVNANVSAGQLFSSTSSTVTIAGSVLTFIFGFNGQTGIPPDGALISAQLFLFFAGS